jgi:hypothetical protein
MEIYTLDPKQIKEDLENEILFVIELVKNNEQVPYHQQGHQSE